MPLASSPPTGVVTMLFTDIEGSTKLAQHLGADWPGVLTEHRRIVRDAIAEAGGYVEGTEGDSFFATFARPADALAAATAAQRGLRGFAWPEAVGELRVRMGLHTGTVEYTDGHYVGLEVHRGARVGAVANGGQVVVTDAARAALSGAEVEDLGWHRLKDFPDPMRLFHLVVDGDRRADAFPPPRTLDVRPTNLPPAERPPVGRRQELDAVKSEFTERNARLVSLIGLGGVGKTTIALAAARTLLDEFDGVWLVRADTLTSGDDILRGVATAAYVRDVPGADLFTSVAARLEGGRYLLLLDNLEHIQGAASLIVRLLATGPGVCVLATSRAPLRLEAERSISIGAMTSDEALAMFMSRAKLADPSLSLADRDTRAAVEALCVRLGFLPLAMELAAARLRLMTPRQLLERLGSALDLQSAEVDRPERQRSVRATIEWTLGLLPPEASLLFTRMGVFLGSPPLDMIERVCGEGIDAIEAAATLVDFSLLHRNHSALELVESLREVAAERLAASSEAETLRERHAEALIIASRAVRSYGLGRGDLSAVVDLLVPDTWAAARWARTHNPRMHCALAANLTAFWSIRSGLLPALEELEAALTTPELRPVERGELLLNRAWVLTLAGRQAEALLSAEEGFAMMAERTGLDRAADLSTLATVQLSAGLFDDAIDSGRQALDLQRPSAPPERVMSSLLAVAYSMILAGRLEEAASILDEAEAIARNLGAYAEMRLANNRADWWLAKGDATAALDLYARSLEGSMGEFGPFAFYDVAGISISLERLGHAEAGLEVGAIVEEASLDWGTSSDTFSLIAGGVPAAMERARASLPVEAARAAEVRGREVSAGARPAHALAIARDVLSKLGVA